MSDLVIPTDVELVRPGTPEVVAATHPPPIDVAIGVLDGDAVDDLVVAGRPEEGTFEDFAAFALDDAVAVASSPLREHPTGTPIDPDDIDDGEADDEDDYDNLQIYSKQESKEIIHSGFGVGGLGGLGLEDSIR